MPEEMVDCDGPDCGYQVPADKPPFLLMIYNSIKRSYPPTAFPGGDVSFCTEECMQQWLNENRGKYNA